MYADPDYLARYIMNSVLSYFEEREQDLILGMLYNEWIEVNNKTVEEIKEKVLSALSKLISACSQKIPSQETVDKMKKEIEEKSIIERAVCYLYLFGIYDDCISRYLLIKPKSGDVPDYLALDNNNIYEPQLACQNAINKFGECVKVLKDVLSDGGFNVRTRFIEMARDLYLLKQRFPEISTFESYLLVDRVFAYAHPRELPIGRHPPEELCEGLKNDAQKFFTSYHEYLGIPCNNTNNEFNEFWDIFCKFLKRVQIKLYYSFQKNGIKKSLEKLEALLKKGQIDYLVIQAPTGSGKTEIMLYNIILATLAKKIIFHRHNILPKRTVPVALIVYPRRALANDQVTRLIKYLQIINDILKQKNHSTIKLSIKYTDIRPKSEINKALRSALGKIGTNREVSLRTKYGVSMYLIRGNNNKYYVEFRGITCPDGHSYPRFPVKNGEIDDSAVLCGNSKIDFVTLTRRRGFGDIHITLFETLRADMFNPVRSLFGYKIDEQVYDHPIIIALDELHTYTDVPGVRYAFMLRRVLNRIRYHKRSATKAEKFGALIMGMSATIPKPHEFLQALFMDRRITEKSIKDYIVKVEEDEKVPLGNEYFIIVVPTRRAPVNALSVTIQTITNIFYNMPSLPREGGDHIKRAIIFAEELNVLHRLKRELSDVNLGAIRRISKGKVFGLQDLRNPLYDDLFKKTQEDFSENVTVIQYIKRGLISKVVETSSWKHGELWWGYMLDTFKNRDRSANTTKFSNVVEYSSRSRGDISKAHIIVSTSSLEVGVDYSDVVLTYQHGAPRTLSALIQRAGRAGRRVYENPLMRVVVGIQISPDIPHQAWLFELFTTAQGKLRDLLDRDMLFLPTETAKEIHKQTLAELILEYIHNKKVINWDECSLPSWIQQNRDNIIDYVQFVFEDFQQVLDEFTRELDEMCNNLSR